VRIFELLAFLMSQPTVRFSLGLAGIFIFLSLTSLVDLSANTAAAATTAGTVTKEQPNQNFQQNDNYQQQQQPDVVRPVKIQPPPSPKLDYLKLTNKKNMQKCPITCLRPAVSSSSTGKQQHSIVDCRDFSRFNEQTGLNETSYLCKCKYGKDERRCLNENNELEYVATDTDSNAETVWSTSPAAGVLAQDDAQTTGSGSGSGKLRDCLVVYVGMAIQSHNLAYKPWIDKDNCFNLCLKTTVRNGFSFDCKSFEHWHRSCPPSPSSDDNANNSSSNNATQHTICASFQHHSVRNEFESDPDHDDDDDHAAAPPSQQQLPRKNVKFDYCVLSNLTIRTAGKLFEPNDKVTYYEILCKRKSV
jgi:hypothetical protein